MRLFSYIITSDSGFAPNPFFGYCTLACCKPKIRKAAEKGDWVAGLTRKKYGNRLVYAMKVDEKISFDEYWNDTRFRRKRPSSPNDPGDNIYEPLRDGTFRQLPSHHTERDIKHDTSGGFVLVSRHFVYFGKRAEILPGALKGIIATRGHKSRFSPEQIQKFENWMAGFRIGRHAVPQRWNEKSNGCNK